jgi:hypothetical protein
MHTEGIHKPSFKVTYINAQWIYPITLVVVFAVWLIVYPSSFVTYLGWENGFDFTTLRHALPHYMFLALVGWLAVYSIKNKASLIPLLSFLACGYLLSESGATNWERFIVWLIIGLIIYFAYGYKRSKLA